MGFVVVHPIMDCRFGMDQIDLEVIALKQRLYVSYAHDDGFGYMIIDGAKPPRNGNEIKILQEVATKQFNAIHPIIINWKVMQE